MELCSFKEFNEPRKTGIDHLLNNRIFSGDKRGYGMEGRVWECWGMYH